MQIQTLVSSDNRRCNATVGDPSRVTSRDSNVLIYADYEGTARCINQMKILLSKATPWGFRATVNGLLWLLGYRVPECGGHAYLFGVLLYAIL